MKIVVIEKLDKGEWVVLPHYEEIEIANLANDITTFSDIKSNRVIGLDKNIYRLSLASYKEVKKELTKRGLISRFDFSKK